MVKTLHQFMFGLSKNKFEEKVKIDDKKAKDLLDNLEDEEVDLLNEKEQDPSQYSSHLSLELSRMNFKSKNLQ